METEDTQGQGTDTGNELIQSFLQNVPEADRAIVEKYVPEWDGQVTKRFQGIHEEYKPYKDLGADAATLEQALNIFNNLNNTEFQKELYETLHPLFGDVQTPEKESELPPGAENIPKEYLELLSPLKNEFGDVKKTVDMISKVLVDQHQASEKAKEDAALERVLADAKSKHGEYDEEYILMKLEQGKDIETAIKEWQGTISKYGGDPTPPPPPSISGSGSIPMKPQSIVNGSREDVKNLVADYLKKVAEQGQ